MDWEDWVEACAKRKITFTWAVAGMLAQPDQHNPEVWDALGCAFRDGLGTDRDMEQAEQWFRKAGNAGHVKAMCALGILLRRDGRSPENLEESTQWFRRAANLGHASGMTFLGFAYREGVGVPLDEREAADWFIKAHAAGAKNAAELAGRLLSWRPEQHVEAVQWLLVATKYGCESAYDDLAGIYEDHRSPLYNPAEAFYCWTQVAATPRGHRRYHAMYTLARWCRDGIGTERNLEEAKRWLDRLMALAPKDKTDYREAADLRRRMDEEMF